MFVSPCQLVGCSAGPNSNKCLWDSVVAERNTKKHSTVDTTDLFFTIFCFYQIVFEGSDGCRFLEPNKLMSFSILGKQYFFQIKFQMYICLGVPE